MKKSLLFLISSILCWGTAASGWSADDAATAKIYAAKCASCHGKAGEGNPSMAKVLKVEASALALSGESLKEEADEDLVKITSEGKGKMPAFKGKLKPEEISALIAYARTLTPKKK